MNRLTIAPLAALALASCNQGPSVSVTNASPEEVAKAAAASGVTASVRAGQWETTSETLSMEMPGLPPGAAQQAAMARKAVKITYCITPEQAAHPGGAVFGGPAEGKGANKCTYDHFTMSNGKVDVQFSCGKTTIKSAGTYTSESTDTEAEMTIDRGMHVRIKAHARRIGECTGKEDVKS